MALPLPPVQLRNNYAGWFTALFAYLVGLVKAFASQQPPTYRAVITSIAAFAAAAGTITAAAPGAIGAQDGITLVAGDRVFLPAVTGGAGGAVGGPNSGPYLVVTPGAGGAAFVLTRPPEFLNGSLILECITFKIGSEGPIWGGNAWRAFPVNATRKVGTDDPQFFPQTFSADVTEAAASLTTWWIKDVNKVAATNKTSANPFFLSTLTPGVPGTAAIVITGNGGDHYATESINF